MSAAPPRVATTTLVEVGPPAPTTARPADPGRRRPLLARLAAGSAPYLYLLPAMVGLAAWTYWPLLETFRLSFFSWDLLPTSTPTWVGLQNYADVVRTPELWQAVRNTVVYALALLLFSVVLPVLVALAFEAVGRRARGFHRAVSFLPFLVAPVATAILWRWLLAPDGGPVDVVLQAVGLGSVDWLREVGPAFVAIVVIVGWKLLGFASLVMVAGLSGIDPEYGRAAALDGATRRQVAWHVTLPLLTPTIAFMALMTVLVGAQWVYPVVDTLTQGGPDGTTTNVHYLLYQYGFSSFDVGLASAAGVLLFLGFTVVALLGLKAMDRFSVHEG